MSGWLALEERCNDAIEIRIDDVPAQIIIDRILDMPTSLGELKKRRRFDDPNDSTEASTSHRHESSTSKLVSHGAPTWTRNELNRAGGEFDRFGQKASEFFQDIPKSLSSIPRYVRPLGRGRIPIMY